MTRLYRVECILGQKFILGEAMSKYHQQSDVARPYTQQLYALTAYRVGHGHADGHTAFPNYPWLRNESGQ